jgi:hypothetical protein
MKRLLGAVKDVSKLWGADGPRHLAALRVQKLLALQLRHVRTFLVENGYGGMITWVAWVGWWLMGGGLCCD